MVFEGLINLIGGGHEKKKDEDEGEDAESGAVEDTEEWDVHNLHLHGYRMGRRREMECGLAASDKGGSAAKLR